MVCLLAVAFGQVALDVAVFVQSTPLVDELLTVSVFERLDDPPPPSVTQRIRLESFNPRRSNSSSNSSQISWFSVAPSQKPRGSFFPSRSTPSATTNA